MGKTTVVIMAAGIGSRFGGGVKQLEPVGPGGEIIMDYSIHDALLAGFDDIVFIIRKDIEKDFREVIGGRISKKAPVSYAFQELGDLPSPFLLPAGRTKPWGTGQAVLSARGLLQNPFLVINADDYYGKEGFFRMHDYMTKGTGGAGSDDKAMPGGVPATAASGSDAGAGNRGVAVGGAGAAAGNGPKGSVRGGADHPRPFHELSMAGFTLSNTLSENGGVTRGVCRVGEDGYLLGVNETYDIYWENDPATGARKLHALTDAGAPAQISPDQPVSMNMWGLTPDFLDELDAGFRKFLGEAGALPERAMKSEYLLPKAVDDVIKAGRGRVRVLHTPDRWFGVTYREDKAGVAKAIRDLVDQGVYPAKL
ncbi:MAG: nucleotidyltransferase [Lachnospiraceae bacterium]|jgi:hypothetical protein|nr:nucleotidyltransferase [Lachnospiraceae bacterium]